MAKTLLLWTAKVTKALGAITQTRLNLSKRGLARQNIDKRPLALNYRSSGQSFGFIRKSPIKFICLLKRRNKRPEAKLFYIMRARSAKMPRP